MILRNIRTYTWWKLEYGSDLERIWYYFYYYINGTICRLTIYKCYDECLFDNEILSVAFSGDGNLGKSYYDYFPRYPYSDDYTYDHRIIQYINAVLWASFIKNNITIGYQGNLFLTVDEIKSFFENEYTDIEFLDKTDEKFWILYYDFYNFVFQILREIDNIFYKYLGRAIIQYNLGRINHFKKYDNSELIFICSNLALCELEKYLGISLFYNEDFEKYCKADDGGYGKEDYWFNIHYKETRKIYTN